MIQEKGIDSDIYGQTILSAALLVDFFAMIAISALAGIVVSGSAQGALGSLALVAIAVPAIRLLPRLLARVPAARLDNRTTLPFVSLSLALLFLTIGRASCREREGQ